MSPSITLDGLSYQTPDGRLLFENLSFAIGPGRTGLVGRNGVGKTTLLRLILDERAPMSGAIAVNGRIGVLRQTLVPDEVESVAARMGLDEALARLARIERGDGSENDLSEADWLLESRIAEALARVGMVGLDLSRSVASLSGGELTRVSLAGLLAQEADVLLLDEPTNNLDVATRGVVREIVRGWKGLVLAVSHDRALLREMDRIVELTTLGAEHYGGNYDVYAARKALDEQAAARDLAVAQRNAATVERDIQTARETKAKRDASGRRNAARGGTPRIVLGAMEDRAEGSSGRGNRLAEKKRDAAAEELARAGARVERLKVLRFDMPMSQLAAGKTVLVFDDVSFGWPGAAASILSETSLRLVGPERVAVTGANGSGKTTLLRLAAGELVPDRGTIARGVPAVLLDQQTALLHDEETLVEAFLRLNPKAAANTARAALARFLFRNIAADKRVANLSGGERLRAAMACTLMAATPPQLLILDEPTNHLDLDSLGAVEAALAGYDGALLVVSHDVDFLDAIGITRTIELQGGG